MPKQCRVWIGLQCECHGIMYYDPDFGPSEYASIEDAIRDRDIFQVPFPAFSFMAGDLIDDRYWNACANGLPQFEYAFPLWHF